MDEFFASPWIDRKVEDLPSERFTLRAKWEAEDGTRYAAYVREGMEQVETIDDGIVTIVLNDEGDIEFPEDNEAWKLLEEKGLVEPW